MTVATMTNAQLKETYKETCRAWAIANLKEDLKLMEKIELEAYKRNLNLW